jgi:hypothetical protein
MLPVVLCLIELDRRVERLGFQMLPTMVDGDEYRRVISLSIVYDFSLGESRNKCFVRFKEC